LTNNIVGFDFKGVKVIKDANTALIRIKGQTINGTITMTDIRDGSKYQVPAGKKATMIYITDSPIDINDETFYADNLDGTTNAVKLWGGDQNTQDFIFISAEIPANKFFNVTSNQSDSYDYTIIEENA